MMLATISSRKLSEWMAYYQIEPFGEERGDLRAAIIASTLANIWRGKNSKSYKPSDFMPKFDEQQNRGGAQTAEQMRQMLSAFAGAMAPRKK